MVDRGSRARGVALPPDRLIAIDEGLDSRLASQLEQRGRKAKSAVWLGFGGMKDERLLRALAGLEFEVDPVLVTGDDRMPLEHGALIADLRITVATLDGRRPSDWGQEEWKKEIVHRWAHAMHEQRPNTIERYGLHRHGPWSRRRR